MVSNGLVVTGVLVLVSQMVFVSKVPKCLKGAEKQGGMGNWEICRGMYFPISQKMSAHLAQHYLGNWEVGKSVEVCTSQFPK